MKKTIGFLFACIAAGAVQEGYDVEWEQAMASGKAAFVAARYEEAERLYTIALGRREAAHTEDALLARSLLELGKVRIATGNCEGGSRLEMRAAQLFSSLSETRPDEAASAWQSLASGYDCQHLLAQAEHAYRRALALNESSVTPSSPDVAVILSSLGAVYQQQHKYAAAGEVIGRAREILRPVASVNPRATALLLNNLGTLYRLMGRLLDAEKTLREAQATDAMIPGAHELSTVYILNNLAITCTDRKQYSKAAGYFSQVAALVDAGVVLPRNDAADILQSYAVCLKRMGRKRDGGEMMSRANMLRSRVGSSDPRAWSSALSELEVKK